MAANQDNDDDMEDVTAEMEGNDDIDGLLESLEISDRGDTVSNMTARRRIEELLEERRLREQIDDYSDWMD